MAFKISNESKVGAFTLVTIALLILGYNILRGKNLFSKEHTFYVKYEQLDGLSLSNPVRVNGLEVGKVVDRYLLKDGTGMVEVELSIDGDLEIPVGSVARIISDGLLGAKSIDLDFSASKKFHQPGDHLIGEVQESLQASVSKEILPIKIKAEQLITSIDSMVTFVRILFADFSYETRINIKNVINSVTTTLGTLENITGNMNKIVQNNIHKLDEIFTNLAAVSDTIKMIPFTSMINQANGILKETRQLISSLNNPEGNIGLLLHDHKLYNDVDAAMRSLDSLLSTIQRDGFVVRLGGKKKK